MLQSDLPCKISNWCMMFASIAPAIDKPCPIHAHERDAAGDVLPEYAYKENRTCEQEHHGGENFLGKIAMFGQFV